MTCDAITGKCHCKCDVEGDKCDTCTDGHKGFPDCHGQWFSNIFVKKFKNFSIYWEFFFLTECNCDKDGSSTFVCDKATGQCTCKTLVVGLTCDKCDDGYYDFPNPCKRK